MRPQWSVFGLSEWIEHLQTTRLKTTARLQEFALAWLLAPAPQVLTTALVYAGLSEEHHAQFYRLFSDVTWDADAVGKALFHALLSAFVPAGQTIHLSIDDTLTHHNGPTIDAVGCHLDPVRSTKTYKVKAFGHVWVIVALRLRFPFSNTDFALPVGFRLYRTEKDCEATGETFRTKTELAAELLTEVSGWLEGRQATLSVDSAYFCAQVLQNRPAHIEVVGAMKSNAVLRTATPAKVPGQPGRPREQGYRLPSPAEIYADDEGYPWQEAEVEMYRGVRRVRYKSLEAQWSDSNGPELMRVVLVKMERGKEDFRIYASTCKERDAKEVLAEYAGRWSQEAMHRNLKQEMGFGTSGVRNPQSVARLPPFVGFLYTITVAWYAAHGCGSDHDRIPLRPWYPHKTTPSFSDMIAAAQHAIRASGVFPKYGQHDFPRNLIPPWHERINNRNDNPLHHDEQQQPQPERIAS